jgi:hypothetical protein
MCRLVPFLFGFERRLSRDSFPSPSETLTNRPSPGLSGRVHTLGLPLLFEVPSLRLPATPRWSDHSCLGSVPLRDVTDEVHALVIGSESPFRGAEGPNPPLRSALRFSQPIGGLLRRRVRGLVSSRCRVQGSFRGRPGVSPDPRRFPARRWTLPPCRWCARTDRRPGRHSRVLDFEASFCGIGAFVRVGV